MRNKDIQREIRTLQELKVKENEEGKDKWGHASGIREISVK